MDTWQHGLGFQCRRTGQCISALKPEVQVLVQVQRLPPSYTVLFHEVTRLMKYLGTYTAPPLRALVPEARVFVCPCLVSTILEIRAAQQRQSQC